MASLYLADAAEWKFHCCRSRREAFPIYEGETNIGENLRDGADPFRVSLLDRARFYLPPLRCAKRHDRVCTVVTVKTCPGGLIVLG